VKIPFFFLSSLLLFSCALSRYIQPFVCTVEQANVSKGLKRNEKRERERAKQAEKQCPFSLSLSISLSFCFNVYSARPRALSCITRRQKKRGGEERGKKKREKKNNLYSLSFYLFLLHTYLTPVVLQQATSTGRSKKTFFKKFGSGAGKREERGSTGNKKHTSPSLSFYHH